jgi:hypothetical protein
LEQAQQRLSMTREEQTNSEADGREGQDVQQERSILIHLEHEVRSR